ncbi:hypothetical protein CL616_01975 [archaeon]|nr:hypothetical protein [archaeon]|tara:strand:+ start:147 stop:773 length:627 start_codon:yes stop_codon:yes gene_type:complete
MTEVIITYENLYELLRREKYRTELQKMEPLFYKNVIKYLNEKEAILESQSKKDSIFASTELEKTRIQLKNIRKILKEVYEKRESKIIKAALFASRSNMAQDTSMMLPEELAFYKELSSTFSNYKENILIKLLQNQLPSIKLPEQKDLKTPDKTDTLAIKVIQDIPEFVGPDMETYGPFETGEIIHITAKIAEMLLNSKQAENETTQEN